MRAAGTDQRSGGAREGLAPGVSCETGSDQGFGWEGKATRRRNAAPVESAARHTETLSASSKASSSPASESERTRASAGGVLSIQTPVTNDGCSGSGRSSAGEATCPAAPWTARAETTRNQKYVLITTCAAKPIPAGPHRAALRESERVYDEHRQLAARAVVAG